MKIGYETRYEVLPFYWTPQSKREYVLNYVQSKPQVGAWTTWKSITEHCVGIKLMEVREILREYTPGQLMKPVKAHHRPVMAMIPDGPHTWFQLDTIFLNKIGTVGYVLLMIDVMTKYLWAFPMTSTKSETAWEKAKETIMKEHQIFKDIYKGGASPQFRVHTDNGSEFKKDFDEGLASLNITHVFGYPYHPWSQGVVERAGKTLKGLIALQKVQSGSSNWRGKNNATLEEIRSHYNDTIHSTTNLKPSNFHTLTSTPWSDETRKLVEIVKNRMRGKASKNQWEER